MELDRGVRQTADPGGRILDRCFDFDIVGESYYIQGIYRIDPRWEMVVRYDVFFGNVDDRDGSKFEAATGLPSHLQFAKDWTVGVRYNITPSLMATGRVPQYVRRDLVLVSAGQSRRVRAEQEMGHLRLAIFVSILASDV